MDAKSRALLERLEARIGTYADLLEKGDIELKYNYDAVGRGQNISLERHIYDGEHSWASFQTHFIKEFDATAGTLQQSLVNHVTTAKVGEEEVSGPEVDQSVRFHRQVNFYWLTMMYKLRDPGTIFKHLGAHQENGVTYEKVHLTYDPAVTGKAKNDQYVLCFNPETDLVDIFFWSGGSDKPLDKLMKTTVEHQIIEGIYIPIIRKNYRPNGDGTFLFRTVATFSEIKFNNGFRPQDLKLEE